MKWGRFKFLFLLGSLFAVFSMTYAEPDAQVLVPFSYQAACDDDEVEAVVDLPFQISQRSSDWSSLTLHFQSVNWKRLELGTPLAVRIRELDRSEPVFEREWTLNDRKELAIPFSDIFASFKSAHLSEKKFHVAIEAEESVCVHQVLMFRECAEGQVCRSGLLLAGSDTPGVLPLSGPTRTNSLLRSNSADFEEGGGCQITNAKPYGYLFALMFLIGLGALLFFRRTRPNKS